MIASAQLYPLYLQRRKAKQTKTGSERLEHENGQRPPSVRTGKKANPDSIGHVHDRSEPTRFMHQIRNTHRELAFLQPTHYPLPRQNLSFLDYGKAFMIQRCIDHSISNLVVSTEPDSAVSEFRMYREQCTAIERRSVRIQYPTSTHTAPQGPAPDARREAGRHRRTHAQQCKRYHTRYSTSRAKERVMLIASEK